jgi:hypothetical protein
MKKIASIIMICLHFCLISNAQDNITVSVEKVIENGEVYTKVSIKNWNANDIRINSFADWAGSNEYLISPISYLRFLGNPDVLSNKIVTGKIILTTKYDIKGPYRAPKTIIIKSKETHTEKYKLFGEDIVCYRAFTSSDKAKIKKLQVDVQIRYIYNMKSYEKLIKSNLISL